MIDKSLAKLFTLVSYSYSLEIISKTIFDFILAAINKEAYVTFESPEDYDYHSSPTYYIHWNNKILSLTVFVDGTIDNLDFDYVDNYVLPDGVCFSYWDHPDITSFDLEKRTSEIYKFEPFGYTWPEPYNRIYDGDKLFMNILREAYYTKYPSK